MIQRNFGIQSSVSILLQDSIALNLNIDRISRPWGTSLFCRLQNSTKISIQVHHTASLHVWPMQLLAPKADNQPARTTTTETKEQPLLRPTTGRKREKQDNWSKRPPCYKGTRGLFCSSCGLPVDSWEGDTSHWKSYGWMDMTRDFWIWGASQFLENNPNFNNNKNMLMPWGA